MPPEIKRYRGREQSYIKHLFLNKYLEAAAFKLLQSRAISPTFNFVDAFAGPWQVSDDDNFSDASFSQAIDTLEAVRRALTGMGRAGLRIRYRFCEQDPESAAKLRRFAMGKQEFDIQVFQGTFEHNIENISSACRDGFTFTFIDPTGWNIDSEKIFSFLKNLNGEFLFNFMAEEIDRHAGWDGVSESFGRFLAEPTWKKRFSDLPNSWPNERKTLHLLKARMKESNIATYLPEMAILRPRRNRIKMRLILGTHSVHGVDVFRRIQEKVEKEAVSVRHDIAVEDSGEPFLFPSNQVAELQSERNGVGCRQHRDQAAIRLLKIVSDNPGIQFVSLAGAVMEDVPVRKSHLNKITMELRKVRQLGFDLPARRRTPASTTLMWPG
ncbi:MAG: three-Cys-motif partner protein TcmP [Rhodospirillaceae bacterium]|nr:three-Cys-motif partner protein TcmP [Rhodospirillaceae bacterium]